MHNGKRCNAIESRLAIRYANALKQKIVRDIKFQSRIGTGNPEFDSVMSGMKRGNQKVFRERRLLPRRQIAEINVRQNAADVILSGIIVDGQINRARFRRLGAIQIRKRKSNAHPVIVLGLENKRCMIQSNSGFTSCFEFRIGWHVVACDRYFMTTESVARDLRRPATRDGLRCRLF